MSKEINDILRPQTNNNVDEYYAVGNRVYVNQLIVKRMPVAFFCNENEAAAFVVTANRRKKKNTA